MVNTLKQRRIWIIGCPSAGKTTVGSLLSQLLSIPLIELDNLYWEGNWARAKSTDFSLQVENLTNQHSWIVTGDYDDSNKILCQKVDTIIFLDVPYIVACIRLIKRTFLNIVTRKDLGHGNKESIKRLLGKDSIIIYLVKIYKKSRTKNLALIENMKNVKVKSIILRNQTITEIIELLTIKLDKFHED